MKNYNKGFAPIIIILIAVIALGGGAYVYSKKSKKADVSSNTEVDSNASATTTATTTTKTTIPNKNSGNVDTTVKITIDPSSSLTLVSGTARNVSSVHVDLVANTPATPTGFTTLYGKTVSVVSGKWSLSIPVGTINGYGDAVFTIKAGTVNSNGSVNVLSTKTLTSGAIPNSAM
jgi:hypothetical protein